MVQILVDSTADLGTELTKRYNIHVIPLYVHLDEQAYADGVNITNQDLFGFVDATGRLPKTSAPSVPDFQQYFTAQDETIYIGLSGQLSTTCQNAFLAQQTAAPGQVFVIDSLNLSTGIGLLAIQAAELRDQGLPAVNIDAEIRHLVSKVRTLIALDTLEYVYKGGRCSAVQNLMGGLLHIHPILTVRPDGTLGIKGRTRGSRKKALDFMLDDLRDNLAQIDMRRVFITHTGCDADAEMLKQELLNTAPFQEVHITCAGSVIASHCGPETIGILYMLQ